MRRWLALGSILVASAAGQERAGALDPVGRVLAAHQAGDAVRLHALAKRSDPDPYYWAAWVLWGLPD